MFVQNFFSELNRNLQFLSFQLLKRKKSRNFRFVNNKLSHPIPGIRIFFLVKRLFYHSISTFSTSLNRMKVINGKLCSICMLLYLLVWSVLSSAFQCTDGRTTAPNVKNMLWNRKQLFDLFGQGLDVMK
jgi:hypothetical protein